MSSELSASDLMAFIASVNKSAKQKKQSAKRKAPVPEEPIIEEDVISEASFGAREPTIDDTVPHTKKKPKIALGKIQIWKEAKKSKKVPERARAKTPKDVRGFEVLDKGEDGAEAVITCYQKCDCDRLAHINELEMPEQLEVQVSALYESVFFTTKTEGNKKATRDPDLLRTRKPEGYHTGNDPEGRVHGDRMQSLPGSLRRLLCHTHYHDVDCQNSHPVLFSQLAGCTGILSEYAKDRASVFARVREQKEFESIDDKKLKTLFMMCLNGEPGSAPDFRGAMSPVLVAYKTAVDEAALDLSHLPKYQDEIKMAMDGNQEAIKKTGKTNQMGRFVSIICNRAERKVLFALVAFFNKTRHQAGVLLHDGLLVERAESVMPSWMPAGAQAVAQSLSLPASVLRDAETFVMRETGYWVKLAEKSLKPTEADWEFYNGPKSLNKIKTDLLKSCYMLSRVAKAQQLKRMNGFVYRPHDRIPGVFLQSDDCDDFINSALVQSQCFKGSDMKSLTTWFKTKSDPHFELLTMSKFSTGIAFINGCFDLQTMKFDRYIAGPNGEAQLEDGRKVPITGHYFDLEIDITSIADQKTPLWDKLIETQLGKRSVCCECGSPAMVQHDTILYCYSHAPEGCDQPIQLTSADCLEILIGRLFYNVGSYDNWQITIFLLGDSNSGKSTLLEIVNEMFPAGSVGCLGSEDTFGLASLYTKRLVVIPDMPENIASIMSAQTWQSMTSGEQVSVAIKHKDAKCDKKWTAPQLMAGNCAPNWKDKKGAVFRRLAIFEWSNLIESRDPSLKKKIIAQELVTILLRCVALYRLACERFESKEFWEHVAPQSLKDS